MRLLVITNLFAPDRGGGASVFTDLCLGLRERGWEVTVFTTHPYYPEWRRKSEAKPWPIQREDVRGVRVLRHWLYVPSEPSRLLPRVLFELSFGVSLLRSLFRGGRNDAVMVFCPMLSAVLFAALRRLMLRETLWLNVQDIPADAAASSGISQSGAFNRAASWLQELLFNCADVWSTISPVMVERLSPLRRRGQPLHLCPNWLNGSLAGCVEGLPVKLGRQPADPVRLLYAGNIGKKQGLLEFCQRLAATGASFRFQIHGNGGEAEAVRDWVAGSGDARFAFGEFLDEPGFTRALHDADVFVITEKPGVGASFIPSKLIPGIASGTPLFAVCDRSGPLGREMSEAGLGVVLEWGEFELMRAKLDELTGDPQRFRTFQECCLAHARNYSRDVAIPRIADLLREAVARG